MKHNKIPDLLQTLPTGPGVYLMRNEAGKVIYVGKAKVLANRVRQYFQNSRNLDLKVQAMVNNVDFFSTIVTDTEAEALILENNLIKEYQPLYNILLRDDKTYPYIKVTLQEEYPRVIKTRRILEDGARYFGPYTNVFDLNNLLESLHKMYPIRTCKRNIPRSIEKKERPCLQYYIHRCCGPCTGKADALLYREMIEEILQFIQGKNQDLVQLLTEKMKAAAQSLHFEEAAILRDRIQYLKEFTESQKIVSLGNKDQDVIGTYYERGFWSVQIFFVRKGKVVGTDAFLFEEVPEEQKEQLTSFLMQFYVGNREIPQEIILEQNPEDQKLLEEIFQEQRGKKVVLTVPHRGFKMELLAMVQKNAKQHFMQQRQIKDDKLRKGQEKMEELRGFLNLEKIPRRVESFDISHIAGVDSVGGQVVFVDGYKSPKDYRRYRIKTVEGVDDYKSLQEIVLRRMAREPFPDLILVDGGKGQVSALREALSSIGSKVLVFGIYKDDRHRTEGLCSDKELWKVPRNHGLYSFLGTLQEEVHRFAVDYHRSLRDKSMKKSILDDIPGIGKKRKKILLEHFKGMDRIKESTAEDLAKIKGIDRKTAENIVAFFRKGGNHEED